MKYFLIFFFAAFTAYAQNDSTQQNSHWQHSLVAGVNVTQMSLTDWAAGGESALSYSSVVDGKSVQDLETTTWSNTYKLAYGQTRLGSKPLRKTDDKIEFESVLTYKVGTIINPYISATLKTQLDVGYKYDDAAGTKTLVSRFWAPAYLTQAVGFGYQPISQIKTRLGAALREVRTKFGYMETNKTEGGIESVTDAQLSFSDNLLFTGKLELFSAFDKLNLWIVRSDNTLAAKVSNIVTVTINVQFINDANVQARTQIKEVLALGIVYTFI